MNKLKNILTILVGLLGVGMILFNLNHTFIANKLGIVLGIILIIIVAFKMRGKKQM